MDLETETPVASLAPEKAGDDVEMKDGDAAAPAPEPSAVPESSEPEEPQLPEGANETLYIKNLNESIRVDTIKQTLLNLFKPYRPMPPVVAHRNLRMRGQAFISFPDKEVADKAMKEVTGFPLYGKPMQISFAKTRSDVVVEKVDGAEELEKWKEQRKEQKYISRNSNPIRMKQVAKHKAALASATAAGALASDTGAAVSGAPATRRTQIQMPDEYLPPNRILFIQNLSDDVTKEDLQEVFEQHPNFVEIRLIPAKRDIAFVEYGDEGSATVAKDALHNFKIDGETRMKVTYARR